MLEKALTLLFGLASIAVGVRSIITREARFSLGQRTRRDYGDYGNDNDEQLVDGFPAILVGLFEIALGIYVLVNRHVPW